MPFFMEFPFDHAVQINYNSSGQETSRTTVTSGNVKFGYEKYTGEYPTLNYLSVPRYAVELYFRIPQDAYKYSFVYKGLWYENSVSASNGFKSSYQRYYYYADYRWTPAETGTNVSSGNLDWNSAYTNPYVDSRFKPGDRAIYENRLSNIKFSETDVNVIQRDGIEYLYIKINPIVDLLKEDPQNYFSASTELHTFSVNGIIFGMDANPITLNVSPVYPVNVYTRNDKDLIVDWDFSNNINRSSTYLYQTSNVVTITDKNGDSIETGITGSTDSQVTFDAEDLADLAIGECTVHVVVTSNYDTTGEATFTFELVGQSSAPDITSITQDSYPTISWDSTDQISWEMIISNSQGVVYKSGMMIGDDQSFTVPILLEDGGYSVELRYVNSYGLLTAWGSAFVDLQPTKPDAPEGIIVSARTDYGVSVSCSDMVTTGKLLVVRRKDENSTPVVLGEYNGTFVDYLIGLNDYHQYTIRNYVQGYADGEWIDGVVLADGEVVRDADDYSKFIHVWKTDEAVPNYAISEDKSDVLVQCIGRKYPVAELGEWVTSTRRFSGHVSDVDLKKLRNMKLNSSHVLLQGNEEYMPCYMEFSDAGQYIDGGRMINFNMTRIDGEK